MKNNTILFFCLSFLILTFITACAQPGGSTGTPTNPTPGNNGTLSTSLIGNNSITINWTGAGDESTNSGELQYIAYYSVSDNLKTVSQIESNGIPVGAYSANITSKTVNSLTPGTTFYFAVIVKDDSGNKSAYVSTSAATTATGDSVSPTPGAGGNISFSSVTAISLSVNWTAGTDNVDAQSTLQYMVYYSASDNLTGVFNIEKNGTPVGSYSAGITTKNVSSLTSGTLYYFSVIIKDAAGNKAAYTSKSVRP